MPKSDGVIFNDWEKIFLYSCVAILFSIALFVIVIGFFMIFKLKQLHRSKPQIDNQLVVD